MRERISTYLSHYCSVEVVAKQVYSGTSVSGPSQQRPTSLQRPKHRVRIDFSIDLTHFEPPNNGNGNLQTPASGQRPGSGTLYFRRKLPPRTAKFKTTPLFVKPHLLFVRRIQCNIHPYKGHLSTRAKCFDPKVALLRRFHCIHYRESPSIRWSQYFEYVKSSSNIMFLYSFNMYNYSTQSKQLQLVTCVFL